MRMRQCEKGAFHNEVRELVAAGLNPTQICLKLRISKPFYYKTVKFLGIWEPKARFNPFHIDIQLFAVMWSDIKIPLQEIAHKFSISVPQCRLVAYRHNLGFRPSRVLAVCRQKNKHAPPKPKESEIVVRELFGDERAFSECGTRYCQTVLDAKTADAERICCGKKVKVGKSFCPECCSRYYLSEQSFKQT